LVCSSIATPETVISDEDLAEAYLLHLSSHPSFLIISMIFYGNGFGSWKCSMTIALSTKNKLCFMDGSLAKPNLVPLI